MIVITAILAATLTIFLKPAIDSYFDTRRRVDLTAIADTALRRMAQDIRSAVPNSIRPGPGAYSTSCFQLVPTIAGGAAAWRRIRSTTRRAHRLTGVVCTANSATLDAGSDHRHLDQRSL